MRYKEIFQMFSRILVFDQGNNFSNMSWMIDQITIESKKGSMKKVKSIALFNLI